jgi:hypothetical protein
LVGRARVVGWPPVRSYRKNALADVAGSSKANQAAKFVKVAVDGAPYLRKVDLQAYAGYDQLLRALQDKFFSHFTISQCWRPYHPLLRASFLLAFPQRLALFDRAFRLTEIVVWMCAQGSSPTTRGSWWTR